MNLNPTSPFSLVYFNAQALPSLQLSAWQALVSQQDHAPALPDTPLLYVFVETGHKAPSTPQGWTTYHEPGPTPPRGMGFAGGGITLLYHTDCAVRPLPQHCTRLPAVQPSDSSASSVVCAIVRPRHRAAFLLAAVYLPPQCARTAAYLLDLVAVIEAAAAAHPALPLLIVGDFNCHHSDWHCPLTPKPPQPLLTCATALADWITDTALTIENPAGMITRQPINSAHQSSIIDLVLSGNAGLVQSVTQRHACYLRSDHLPFTVTLALSSTKPPPRPLDPRTRVAWDHHRCPEAWQTALGPNLTTALSPLGPALLALAQPLPPGASAQVTLDAVYDQLEQALTSTCHNVVGTKVISPFSSPWLSFPGVQAARQKQTAALSDFHRHPHDAACLLRLNQARATWRKGQRRRQATVLRIDVRADHRSRLHPTLVATEALPAVHVRLPHVHRQPCL